MATATEEFNNPGSSEGLSAIQDTDEADRNDKERILGGAAAASEAPDGSAAASSSLKVAWICTACTLQNLQAQDACEVCGTTRPPETAVKVTVDNTPGRASSSRIINNAVAVDALTPISSVPRGHKPFGTSL